MSNVGFVFFFVLQLRSAFYDVRRRYYKNFYGGAALAGVLQVIFPEYTWWIEHGMPKDVEPSDAGVPVTRIVGAIPAIIGIIILFTTFN